MNNDRRSGMVPAGVVPRAPKYKPLRVGGRVPLQTLRHAFQILMFFLLTFTLAGWLVQPFLPVLALVLPSIPGVEVPGAARLITHQFSGVARVLTDHWPLGWLLMVLGAFLLVGSVAGRAFCGWACPFGAFQDGVAGVMRRLGIRQWTPAPETHRRLLMVKYFFLAATLFLAVSIGVSVALGPAVADTYWSLLPTWMRAWVPLKILSLDAGTYEVLSFAASGPPKVISAPFVLTLAIWAIVIGGIIATPRFFCRYLCRTGALVSVSQKWSLLGIRKDNARCDGAGLCLRVCPLAKGQDTYAGGRELWRDTANCIQCYRCVEACPRGALSVGFAGRTLLGKAPRPPRRGVESPPLRAGPSTPRTPGRRTSLAPRFP